MTKEIEKEAEFKINPRYFGELMNSIMKHSPDYAKQNFIIKPEDIAYTGIEHRGVPKLPNSTQLINLEIETGIVLGSTLGHQHGQYQHSYDLRDYQEIYEFFGYGMMFLRSKIGSTVDLYLVKPGEKILVGLSDNMTIMNLDKYPLFTHDYANPDENEANKFKEEEKGPFLMVTYQDGTVSFHVNTNYSNYIMYNPQAEHPLVIPDIDLGKDLYDKIRQRAKDFKEKLGIEIKTGGNIPKGLKKTFAPSLQELAKTQDPILLSTFGIQNHLQ